MMQDKDKIAEYDRLAAENSELKSELENLRKQIACLKKAVYLWSRSRFPSARASSTA